MTPARSMSDLFLRGEHPECLLPMLPGLAPRTILLLEPQRGATVSIGFCQAAGNPLARCNSLLKKATLLQWPKAQILGKQLCVLHNLDYARNAVFFCPYQRVLQ